MAPTVGIFSRSGQEEYGWLLIRLRGIFRVVPFYISNTNQKAFRECVSQCHVAILYHSKTRGRINIVDVKDSLYDKELAHLSDKLGKDRVIVVVDDVDDSSAHASDSILQNQPSLNIMAAGTFLFTAADKRNERTLEEKVKPIIQLIRAADGGISSLVPTSTSCKIFLMTAITSALFVRKRDARHAFLALFWICVAARNSFHGGSGSLIPFVNPERNEPVLNGSVLFTVVLVCRNLSVSAWRRHFTGL